MNEKPKVSVVLPFHNRINWVKNAVDSVLNQSYNNFELILIDDGSIDDVKELLIIADERIRYYHQSNKGVSAARNKGIYLARGEFIAFLDSDDLFMPKKIEEQLKCFDEYPDVKLCHTSYLHINEHGEIKQEINTSDMTGDVFPTILYRNQIATPTVMVRKDILNDTSLFLETISNGEDTLLWSEIAEKYPITGINKCLSKVRVHRSSASISTKSLLIGNKNILRHLYLFKSLSLSKKLIVKLLLYKNIIFISLLDHLDTFLTRKMHIDLYKKIQGSPFLMRALKKFKIFSLKY